MLESAAAGAPGSPANVMRYVTLDKDERRDKVDPGAGPAAVKLHCFKERIPSEQNDLKSIFIKMKKQAPAPQYRVQ